MMTGANPIDQPARTFVCVDNEGGGGERSRERKDTQSREKEVRLITSLYWRQLIQPFLSLSGLQRPFVVLPGLQKSFLPPPNLTYEWRKVLLPALLIDHPPFDYFPPPPTS